MGGGRGLVGWWIYEVEARVRWEGRGIYDDVGRAGPLG